MALKVVVAILGRAVCSPGLEEAVGGQDFSGFVPGFGTDSLHVLLGLYKG